MKVIIAPDSFKGSISARDAAAAIANGWHSARPADEIVHLPQADGGEGTLDAFAAADSDAALHAVQRVTGPDGLHVDATWLLRPDGTAVLELAQSSGIALMRPLNALDATTRGLGEVIAVALDTGARALVIGLGGSASTDGGAGALEALADRTPPPGGVTLLTDVTAPLLGPQGAAAVYGPQKGASPADIEVLERRMREWAARFPDTDPATPGAGAAGGTAFGFLASWGARIELGAPAIAELTGLTEHVRTADVLITGEGTFDETSYTGKVVGHALELAQDAAVARTIAIVGRLTTEPHLPDGRPVASISLSQLAGSTQAALENPARWLINAGAQAARDL